VGRGALRVGLDQPRAYWDEVEVGLTVTELFILRMLMGEPDRVFARDELAHSIGDASVVLDGESVDWYLRRIRRKFGAVGGAPVRAIPQRGYCLGVD
jgi:two-component system OmpR family response regulator